MKVVLKSNFIQANSAKGREKAPHPKLVALVKALAKFAAYDDFAKETEKAQKGS